MISQPRERRTAITQILPITKMPSLSNAVTKKSLIEKTHLPQKHYLGVLARAAWFAYLNPSDTDMLYYNWHRKRDLWRPPDELADKGEAFSDFMCVLARRPIYIHSAKQDTDSFLMETTDHEIWIVWRGTQATLEDGFSLRDLYADMRFRLTQCDFLPGHRLRLHAGFLSKYKTMRHKIISEIRLRSMKMRSITDRVTIRCIGHSLGGALAMINAADLVHHSAMFEWDTNVDITCCTFGAPAAGNKAFTDYFNHAVAETTRVVVEDDPITFLPPFPWFSHVDGEIVVRECHSSAQFVTSLAIKGILNHHCAVYIHGSDVLDGKRLPLKNQATLKIVFEGILKTILIYAIILIILHMDQLTIGIYVIFIIIDIFDNHYSSVKKYLGGTKSNIIITN